MIGSTYKGELVISNFTGLRELWAETQGDSRICIAILDGPVDRSHSSLCATNLTQIETLVPRVADRGPSSQHGTHVASVIFGKHNGPIKGIAPGCRGLIVPIFKDGVDGLLASCSQLDLARAILLAIQHGAHIINISGGEFSPSGTAHPFLADAVHECTANNVMIVAATGNEGCDCLHIPGALPEVLAVGAMDDRGLPLHFSNWGQQYQTQGILAPGENIPGAYPFGDIVTNSGTSYATPIVSGIAGLLLSLQLKHGQKPNPTFIRETILGNAIGCLEHPVSDCRRLLTGRINIKDSMHQIIKKRGGNMHDSIEKYPGIRSQGVEDTSYIKPGNETLTVNASTTKSIGNAFEESKEPYPPSRQTPDSIEENAVTPNQLYESKCGCQKDETCKCGIATSVQKVFALGTLGYDFGTEARRDSVLQHMNPPANPYDPIQLLAYLEKNPWDAAAILWTLNLDATPIYAIQAQGAFAADIYKRLRDFLGEQTRGEVERISMPGYIRGSVRLSSGQVVPLIWPELRGMYSWNTRALVEAVCGSPPYTEATQQEIEEYTQKAQAVTNFLQRVYDEFRNLGITSQERASNYAATNAYQTGAIIKEALKERMDLDTIEVERSSICRMDAECWDIKLTFFNPMKVFEQARKVYRFTIDVSDVVPVTAGSVRSWFVR